MSVVDPYDLPEPEDDRSTPTVTQHGRLAVNIAVPAAAHRRPVHRPSSVTPNLGSSMHPVKGGGGLGIDMTPSKAALRLAGKR